MKRLKRFNQNWQRIYFKALRTRYRRYTQNYKEYLYSLINPYDYVD